MSKLKKEVVDALLKDHQAGYSVAEIAARAGLHRNTVARRLAEAAQTESAVAARGRRDKVLAALADWTLLVPCSQCGRTVPVVTSMPNLFLNGMPCGLVSACQCGMANWTALAGQEAAFSKAVEGLR